APYGPPWVRGHTVNCVFAAVWTLATLRWATLRFPPIASLPADRFAIPADALRHCGGVGVAKATYPPILAACGAVAAWQSAAEVLRERTGRFALPCGAFALTSRQLPLHCVRSP